jgi:uncharacterized protein (TIGR03437 family)
MNASVTVQSGLAAAFAFDEGAGLTAADASGNSNLGQLKGGVSWTGFAKHGNALSFNGANGYVDLGSTSTSLKSTGSMSWSAWVYVTAYSRIDSQIIAQSDGVSGWQLKLSQQQTFAVAISGSNNNLTQRYGKTPCALQTWYYVAGIYNAATKTLDIYVNGVLDNAGTNGPSVPGSQYLPNVSVTIGKRNGRLSNSGKYIIDDGYYFPGVIDDLRVYNRALAQTEIQADMITAVTPPAPVTSSNVVPPKAEKTTPVSGGAVVPAVQGMSPSPSRPQGRVSTLACSPRTVSGGSQVTCELRVAGSSVSTVQLASSSNQVRIPASVVTRANQSRLTFQAMVDAAAKEQEVTLTATLDGAWVADIIQVTPASAPVLTVPENQLVRFGTPLRFQVTGADPLELPVQITAAKLPAGATFDPMSGWFDWTPNASQAGSYQIAFTATNGADRSSNAQVTVDVSSGAPIVTSAGACSPGAIGTLRGKWLAEDTLADFSGASAALGGTSVKVNGSPVATLSVSPMRVKFLCPAVEPGTTLSIVVATAAAASDPVSAVMQTVSPELSVLDGSTADQGMVSFASRNEFVTAIDSRMLGRPAQPGDEILLWATGFTAASRLSVKLGGVDAELLGVRAVPGVVGLSTIRARVPAGTALGNTVPVMVVVTTPDGRPVQSNAVKVSVEAANQ